MKRIIDISEDLAVLASHVGAVKRLDADSCAIFLIGQSATDGGFLVERPWDEVIDELNSELEDEDRVEEEEEDSDVDQKES